MLIKLLVWSTFLPISHMYLTGVKCISFDRNYLWIDPSTSTIIMLSTLKECHPSSTASATGEFSKYISL